MGRLPVDGPASPFFCRAGAETRKCPGPRTPKPGHRPFTFQVENSDPLQYERNWIGRRPNLRRNKSFFHGRNFAKGDPHVGLPVYCGNCRVLRGWPRLCEGVRTIMTTWELTLGLVMAVGLTAYLVYAMLRPEKF